MKRFSRREFLRCSAIASTASLLAACGPAATPTTVVEPTKAPEPTKVPEATKAPTATSATKATEAPADPWAIYSDDDPRHWVLNELVEPAKTYDGLEMTTNVWSQSSTYPEGESVEDNVKTRWLKKTMGIQLKTVWSGAEWVPYWTTALASGDLADVMCNANWQYYGQLREADALADITELWEQNASESHKNYKDSGSDLDNLRWKFCSADGRKYAIPGGGPGDVMTDVLWIRQDWLDKLGLKFPETLDELYDTGMAFVKAGLAKYGMWIGNIYSSMWGTMSFVFGAFGNPPVAWKRGADGKLGYTGIEPTIKPALEVLNKWYSTGFLDPEFLTSFDAAKYMGGNLVGIGVGPYWLNSWPLGDSRKNDPQAKWVAGHLPKGPGGKRGRFEETYTGITTAFKKGIDPKIIEAHIQANNFIYEIMDKAQADGFPNTFKGYDYEIVDGKYVAGKFATPRYVGGALDNNGLASLRTRTGEIYAKLKDADPATLNPVQAGWLDPAGIPLIIDAMVLSNSIDYSIVSDFIWVLPSIVSDIQTTVNNLESEAYANIITGKKPSSSFDQFVADWKAQGGQELTDAVNEEDAKHK
jgi:putative aldouronate transport system substrate-binding protein